MGYEEVSKAYRIYDIQADRVVISRDATFDESAFALSPTLPQENMDDIALDFGSMIISDEPTTMEFKPTGKRKDRSNSHEQVLQRTIPARHGAGLEEASAPEKGELRQVKRRSSTQANLDEERKGNEKATTRITMTTHPKPFGERVPTQLKPPTYPSQQRLKMLLMGRIKCIGVKQSTLSWTL